MSHTIYFGYGSNLWLRQMRLRCPDSEFLGIGRLDGWRLQINARGYCNVVQRRLETLENDDNETTWHVYGAVYSLSREDEAKLDVNEGVPEAYTKEILGVQFWRAHHTDAAVDVGLAPEEREMLVYVDRKRTVDAQPKTEYIYRMNRGVEDALRLGVPTAYVEQVVRYFIPEDSSTVLSDKAREAAERQAREFRDP